MIDTPTFFTVLTPTYNRAGTLHRVYAVSYTHLRHRRAGLAVVDDGTVLAQLQHLTGNDDPERTLDWIRDAGATGVVVLKLGKDGSIIDDGKTRTPVAALRVDAVDATGAGDCFAGSLLARR